MGKYASSVVKQAQAWLGRKESNGTHKEIIDVYNSRKPLARGYKVKYTDAWCATFVSAVAVKLGYTDIIPIECGCEQMINLAKKMGIWVEDESRKPAPGWIVFYDWEDSGTGDNKGYSDHVGIVETVSGNSFTVIEGNYSNAVKRRTLAVNGKNLRGYAAPKYDAESGTGTGTVETGGGVAADPVKETDSKKATDSARNFLRPLAGTYKVTATMLNVRNGAGITKKIMVTIPKGTKVQCYGYYTAVGSVNWLYIQFTYKGVTYTGFASSKWLAKA